MATDDSPEAAADLSPEEARQQLIRLITRQDIDEHSEIYDDLARE
ncbi:hypothetical protein [Halomicrococcus sp. NG-SE-24]